MNALVSFREKSCAVKISLIWVMFRAFCVKMSFVCEVLFAFCAKKPVLAKPFAFAMSCKMPFVLQ